MTESIDPSFKTKLLDDLDNIYNKRQEKIFKSAEKHSFFLDKAILTISTGAIAIFFTFYKSITEIIANTKQPKLFLTITIIAFSLSILFVLLSFFFIQRSFKYQLKESKNRIDQKRSLIKKIDISLSLKNQETLINEIISKGEFKDNRNKTTEIFNILASIFVFIGILGSIIFFFSFML